MSICVTSDEQVSALIQDNILYIGFMMREGADGEREPFCFAMRSQPKGGRPAFVLKSGERLANPEDLTDQFLVLHECSFAYNIRRLETMLHTHFWDHHNSCDVRGGQGVTMLVTDT